MKTFLNFGNGRGFGVAAAVCAIIMCACPALRAEREPVVREWTIDGVRREALVYPPTSQTGGPVKPAPVVFAFHGHGGSMRHAARSFHLHEEWPEAIVVYPQGLKTPGQLTDPEGKRTGWQGTIGSEGDRDLAFFDAMFGALKKDYAVDEKRIYATGHSNGGGFSYLLWSARPGVFTAFAPVAAVPGRGAAPQVPRPVLHVAGTKDPLVKFAWQERTISVLRRLNGCSEGRPWEADNACTIYPSSAGTPVVTFIHPGAHGYPDEAPGMIVAFFKQHTLTTAR
jgi:polyhydroxybutyrate depolymerase